MVEKVIPLTLLLALPPPLLAGLETGDMNPHPLKSKFYSESWFHLMRTDDGDLLVVQFLLTNLGLLHGASGVDISYIHKGESIFIKGEYPKDEMKWEGSVFDLKVGKNRLSGDFPLFRIRVEEGGIFMDLSIESWMEGFHAGRWDFGSGRFVSSLVHLPRGRFRGRLGYRGDIRDVTGDIYGDHVYQNILASSFSRIWYSLRLFHPRFTIAMVEFEREDVGGRGRAGFLMAADRGRIVLLADTGAYSLNPSGRVRDGETGFLYPSKFDLSGTMGDASIRGTYIRTTPIERLSPLSHLSALQRGVIKTFVADPVFFRFLSECTFSLDVGGRLFPIKGEGIGEVVKVK